MTREEIKDKYPALEDFVNSFPKYLMLNLTDSNMEIGLKVGAIYTVDIDTILSLPPSQQKVIVKFLTIEKLNRIQKEAEEVKQRIITECLL